MKWQRVLLGADLVVMIRLSVAQIHCSGGSADVGRTLRAGRGGTAMLVASNGATPAACVSLASEHLPQLWSWITPINITIQI